LELLFASIYGGWRQETMTVMTSSHAGAAEINAATRPPSFNLVRNHPLDFGCIRIAHQDGLAQLLLPLMRLGSQHMTQMRMMTHYLPRRSLLEALGSAFVRF